MKVAAWPPVDCGWSCPPHEAPLDPLLPHPALALCTLSLPPHPLALVYTPDWTISDLVAIPDGGGGSGEDLGLKLACLDVPF